MRATFLYLSTSLFLPSEETAKDTCSCAKEAAAGSLGCRSVAFTGEGEDNIIEVNITVSVLILEEVAKLSCNNGNEAYESALENFVEVELRENIGIEKFGCERSYGACRCVSLSCKKVLDNVYSARGGSGFCKAAED